MPQNKQRQTDYLTGGGQLRGFPGYRNRENRFGLDPLDTQAEASFMEGTFYRHLFTLNLRTRDKFHLALMFVFGVIPFSVTVGLVLATLSQPLTWLILAIPTLITLPLSINLVLNLLEITHVLPARKSLKAVQQRLQKRAKRLPKRRKDFK